MQLFLFLLRLRIVNKKAQLPFCFRQPQILIPIWRFYYEEKKYCSSYIDHPCSCNRMRCTVLLWYAGLFLCTGILICTDILCRDDRCLPKTDDAGAASKDTENKTDAQTSTITGTIDDIKDFMFTITDEKGDAYPMSFDAAPEGLSDVKAGDKVTVTYTGELSAVDAFTGTILSVKKAAK